MQSYCIGEICGRLWDDIAVKSTPWGRSYGLLYIWFEKQREFYDIEALTTNEVQLYKAIVWDKEMFRKYAPLLKKGVDVLLRGDIEILPDCILNKHPKLLISVRGSNCCIEILSSSEAESEAIPLDESVDSIPYELVKEIANYKGFYLY